MAIPDKADTARREIALTLDGPEATARLARALAARARPGDVIGLEGGLGTGKTTFARAFIQAAAEARGAAPEEVPSPTFTLVQVYDLPGLSIWHFDLYRLEGPEDAVELGLEEALAGAVSLIEWPERLGRFLPPQRLVLRLETGAEADSRRATLTATGDWARRLEGVEEMVCHA